MMKKKMMKKKMMMKMRRRRNRRTRTRRRRGRTRTRIRRRRRRRRRRRGKEETTSNGLPGFTMAALKYCEPYPSLLESNKSSLSLGKKTKSVEPEVPVSVRGVCEFGWACACLELTDEREGM